MTALVVGLLVGAIDTALAEERNPLDEMVVTAPAYERTVGQAVTTIGQDQLAGRQAFSIGQILQGSPGVSIKQGNGPRDVGISIRGSNARNGFGVRNIQVFEDGFPVTQPDGLSRTDLADPHAYAGVDVYRGPSSAKFGNYATGGAINFRTRTGSNIDGLTFGADGGEFGYANFYGMAGGVIGNFEASGFGSYVRSNGFLSHSSFKTTTENVLASNQVTGDDKITVKFINNNLDTDLAIRQSLDQFKLNPFQKGCEIASTAAPGCGRVTLFVNGRNGATITQSADQAGLGRTDQRTILGVRWQHSFDSATELRTQVVLDNKDINQPTGATSAVGVTPSVNVMSDLTRRGMLFGQAATHSVGVYFNGAKLSSYSYTLAPGGNATLGDLTQRYYGHHVNVGGRLREEVTLTPAWSVVLGVGVESTDLQASATSYSYPLAGAPVTTFIPVDRSFLEVAPEVALIWTPRSDIWIQGRYATGYGTPQASNLFVTPLGVSGNNTQLKAQRNDGLELGITWAPAKALALSATGFYEFFENELVTQSPGAGLQNYTFNAPASEHRGVEVMADWRPFAGAHGLVFYTFNDQIYTNYLERLSAGTRSAVFDRSGNHIPGVEPHSFSARLTYEIPHGPLRGLAAGLDINWRGPFYIDNANLVKVPGSKLVNFNLHYAPESTKKGHPEWMAFIEVQNVFDKTYVASANTVSNSLSATTGLLNPASVVSAATGSIYAGAPRTIIGGVRIKM